ncbi:hypothetical protein ETT65_08330 [Streptococcus pyogenes]|nr:hypothetical protein ETT65_08330 [Streptococcus pyogenes]
MEKETKQMIDLKRNLFKIDVWAQKDEEKVFMRTAWLIIGFKSSCKTNVLVVKLIFSGHSSIFFYIILVNQIVD